MTTWVYNFSKTPKKDKTGLKNLLGGKGANLAEMGRLGFPVPPGFTISTEACDLFYKNKKKIPNKLISQIKNEIKVLENKTKKKFGDLKNPLLISVRSVIFFKIFLSFKKFCPKDFFANIILQIYR